MTEDKLVELVQKIEKRTLAGGLNWERTAIEEEFQAILSNFVIRIRRYPSDMESDDYVISLIDQDGVSLESLNDGEFSRIMAGKNPLTIGEGYGLMARLFKNAKRKALGVDKALDDLLSELDKDSPNLGTL